MGDYAKKMRARLGKKGGVTATAHKLSRIIYTMIRDQKEYDKILLCSDNEKWREKRISALEKQLKQLKKAS